jgi:superfamily II DNA or RNA helicase
MAIAVVRGSGLYQVELWRDGETIEASCTCSVATLGAEVCQHIWATLLAADATGYLQGDDQKPALFLEVESPDDLEGFQLLAPPSRQDAPRRRGRSEGEGAKKAPTWKKTLARLGSATSHEPAQTTTALPPGQEVVYIIDRAITLAGNGLGLEVATRQRKKNGDWGKPKAHSFSSAEAAHLPDPHDRHALAILAGGRDSASSSYYSPYSYGYGSYGSAAARYTLAPALVETLLPIICSTGRCYLREEAGQDELRPLQWDDGGPWVLWLKVGPHPTSKACVVTGELRRGDQRMPLSAPSLLISGGFVFGNDWVASLNDSGAFPWIAHLRQQPELVIPARQKQDFLAELLRQPALPPLDLPDDLQFEEVTSAPRPCLTLKPREKSPWASSHNVHQDSLLGELSFDYDGRILPANDASRGSFDPQSRQFLKRDREAERNLAARLEQVGFRYRADPRRDVEVLELAPRLLPRVVRTLLEEGWRVDAQGKLYRQAGEFQIEVTSGIDWFDLEGGATFGDQQVALPTLLAALRRGEDLVPLGDGSFGILPEEWLKKYLPLAAMGTAEDDRLRFRRSQVGLLDVLLAEQPEARFDKTFEAARDQLRQFQGIEAADPPESFQGQLRAYQRDGLGWLHFLREFGFGGCLADDMGLGKTVQVLALLEERRGLRAEANGKKKSKNSPPPIPPSLVVVPKSLVFNWKQEAARFAPDLRVLDHTGTGRLKPGSHFNDHDVILTTYGTLRNDITEFRDHTFDYAILDEAQAIKNAASQSAKATRLIQAHHRLALSGTPVENHLGELASLFEYLNPGMLGHVSASGKADFDLRRSAGEEAAALVARALRPFILRRTKEQVAKDLPEKTEQTIYCDLEPPQRKLYDELRDHYRQTLLGRVDRDGIKKAQIQILEALLRLRQAACHPGLIDKARHAKDSSAKLDVLLPQLREVFDEGHKTLVFSQFTSLLAIVKDRLDTEKIPYVYLDGRTRDRQARVEQFQTDPNCKVFLISLKAGGLGLNLTAADYVFLLDPWWNPAVEAQAIDRAHRIGQTRPVFAYRLIARDTVEEKVLQLQNQKRALADAIINADNSLIRNLGREDLELLLS